MAHWEGLFFVIFTKYKLQVTNYELWITNYKLRIMNYELWITSWKFGLIVSGYELRITNSKKIIGI